MFTTDEKLKVMRAFLLGTDVADISKYLGCARRTVEDVIREGTMQAMTQLAQTPDETPAEVAQ